MSVCKIKEREGRCDLRTVIVIEGGMSDDVVRWCAYCGAVVVDTDVDGRVHPGKVRPMVFPEIAKKKQDGE